MKDAKFKLSSGKSGGGIRTVPKLQKNLYFQVKFREHHAGTYIPQEGRKKF